MEEEERKKRTIEVVVRRLIEAVKLQEQKVGYLFWLHKEGDNYGREAKVR